MKSKHIEKHDNDNAITKTPGAKTQNVFHTVCRRTI